MIINLPSITVVRTEEVFNYFDKRITNAYTESANNQIKHIYKQGRGYSFEVLRARVLFKPETHKISFKGGIGSGVLGSMEPPKAVNYGVMIEGTEPPEKKPKRLKLPEGLKYCPHGHEK